MFSFHWPDYNCLFVCLSVWFLFVCFICFGMYKTVFFRFVNKKKERREKRDFVRFALS